MQLKNVTIADICTDREIKAMLSANSTSLRAAVLSSGQIFYVPSKDNPRLESMLFKLVARVCGDCEKTRVTPIEFEQWQRQSDTSKKPQSEKKGINTSMEWVFNKAIEQRASDVYLFIGRYETRLEFKVFGYKRLIERFESDQGRRLASLIWSSANSQFDQSAPCDASFSFDSAGKTYRIRANGMLTSDGGNTIACRIRDPKEILNVEDLGYAKAQLEAINAICGSSGGLILFTGATNSGKSTSVTALMGAVPRTEHMIEVADPVEVELENCTHIEIDRYHKNHEEIFGRVLASFVRQNPDVLVLGEIRDERTAAAAVNMAIQGKRVYSTLHSTTAAGVFARLHGLGVPDHVLALPDFIAGIISQNLVPTSCSVCAISYDVVSKERAAHEIAMLAGLDHQGLRFLNSAGCDKCTRGIAGQTLVAEVHPYTLDEGEVYKIITAKEYYLLTNYMRQVHNVISKEEHAVEKMNRGEIDPFATMRIIGGFQMKQAQAQRAGVETEREQQARHERRAERCRSAREATKQPAGDKRQDIGFGM